MSCKAKCYFCKKSNDDGRGEYLFWYTPSTDVLCACSSTRWLWLCKDCYIRETRDYRKLKLAWYSDYDQTNIGVVGVDNNIIFANIDIEQLLAHLSPQHQTYLKEEAINRVIKEYEVGDENE